jgi:hypothetical protein
MLIDLKEVKACKNKAFGNFMIRGHDSILITISKKLNTTIAEYGATVLHELLHLWVTILRLKGFRATDDREHEFIDVVERAILILSKKYLRRIPKGEQQNANSNLGKSRNGRKKVYCDRSI